MIGPQRASERRETPWSNLSLRSGRRLVRERTPDLVDDAARIAFRGLLEVLLPEPQARGADERLVPQDDVQLGVVEERVLVEVRRADCHPGVVDDSDLRVHVHGVPAWLKERAREKPLLAAALLRRFDEYPELPARVVFPIVRIRGQHDDDSEVRMRWIAELVGEDLDQLR